MPDPPILPLHTRTRFTSGSVTAFFASRLTKVRATSPTLNLNPICLNSCNNSPQLARCSSFSETLFSTVHRFTHSFCAFSTAVYRSRWGSEKRPETGNVRVMSDA